MIARSGRVLALLVSVAVLVGGCTSDGGRGSGPTSRESTVPGTTKAPPPPPPVATLTSSAPASSSAPGSSAPGSSALGSSTPVGAPASSKTPQVLLGLPYGPSQKGFGTVRPRTVFNGGDPTGLFSITWDTWGGPEADGHGTALWAPGMVADGRTEPSLFRAYDLGVCAGKRVYLRLAAWFPQHGEHFDPKTNGESKYRLCPS